MVVLLHLFFVLFVLRVEPTKSCGFSEDCPRAYSIADIKSNAQEWDIFNWERRTELSKAMLNMERSCFGSKRNFGKTGGWCLRSANGTRYQYGFDPEQTYFLPWQHVPADDIIVSILLNLTAPSGSNKKRMSINDFGAGVGQYGHALKTMVADVRYAGFDGAGNVVSFTNGFVSPIDLTLQLSLPKADWVVSLEVGEHIPNKFEDRFISNLHSHNCRGIVLSWAVLNQSGHGHINNHSPEYLRDIFSELGYRRRDDLSTLYQHLHLNSDLVTIRHPGSVNRYFWFKKSFQVYERLNPTNDCT